MVKHNVAGALRGSGVTNWWPLQFFGHRCTLFYLFVDHMFALQQFIVEKVMADQGLQAACPSWMESA